MLRSLIHFWRLHLPVLLGAAVTAAVLTGALAVGDSMRAGLRRLWLERLGDVELAAQAPRFFRAELADETARRLGGAVVAPAIVLRGTAEHAGNHRRAARIAILGVDRRFAALYAGEPRQPAPGTLPGAAAADQGGAAGLPRLAINETLARQLGARTGDDILVSWERPSAIPREMLLAARDPEGLLATHRFTAGAIVPDRGAGSFALAATQAAPANAFLPLAELQHELEQEGRANTLLIGRSPPGAAAAPAAAVAASLRLDDLGLTLRPLGAGAGSTGGTGDASGTGGTDGASGTVGAGSTDGGSSTGGAGGTGGPGSTGDPGGTGCGLVLESRDFFLPPAAVAAAEAAAAELGIRVQPVLTYLAIELAAHGRSVPYSLVSALGPAPASGALRLAGGGPAAIPAGDEMLLDSWAAEDLAARPGDAIEMRYFLPETGSAGAPLRTAAASFRLSGVVALAGLAADRGLTPTFPGIDQAPDMAAWSPPFPVDLRRVRPRDEAYWHRYGPTPKAFVALAAGRRRWGSRFGDLTSLRLACPAGTGATELAARFAPRLLARLRPEAFGLALLPVRADGLRAAADGTDFSSLFVSFSAFLIVSAALSSGLLFTLGVERRARELGLLLALGYPAGAVRRRFLGEGLALAGGGALLGLGGAAVYTALLVGELRGVAGVARPDFAASLSTLAWGWCASVATVLGFLAAGVRRMSRLPVAQLLAGTVAAGRGGGGRRFWRWLAAAALGAAAVLAWALAGARGGAPALAFGAAGCLLAAGVSAFALWCLGASERRAAHGGLLAMGIRNTAANPRRSVLCVTLVACACLALVLVAANRRDAGGRENQAWEGWNLIAESATPLFQDLGRPDGRAALGFPAAAEAVLAGTEIVGLAVVPGDDASCLNLYRPRRPRLLGVPRRLAARRGASGGGGGSAAAFAALFARGAAPAGGGGTATVPAIGDEESVRWILHLGIGDAITVAGDAGEPVRLRIAGWFAGSPLQDALLIPDEELARHFPRHGGRSCFLVRTPAGREAAVAGLLAGQLRDLGFTVQPVAERLRLYARIQETYLASFQALGGFGLLLGTAGLAVVLLRNVVERRWELAALRAFGFRRRRLAALLLLENATLLVLGVGLGTVAGLLPEALGAGLSGSFPWRSLAGTLAAVLLAGMLAAGVAVAGALAAPLLPVLKAER